MVREMNRLHAGKASFDLLFVVGLIAGWFVLQAFVLPGLGVST